jgi:phage N-6-adenine-methyltransferase|uniref:DNA N-6-adenine-methyltransferase n=1 Tax=Podoviridae sp. ct4s49 TaxID=2823555 RepID=A0A8S5LED4_9CAUD|nr:MAG TPA: DNA N-6-adenine-methyltransferase [Podoviridae sp. ct4s49]
MTDFDKNTWQTPKYFFKWLDMRFEFHVDGCANEKNALCPSWIGEGSPLGSDFLDTRTPYPYSHMRFYVNPPYSDVTPFLKAAKELRDKGHLVVMLLNNDKSTQWYQNHIQGVANEVIDIVGGRIAFIHPVTGQEIKGNSKGQMVVVFDPTMQDFVTRSVSLDFVKKLGGYES